MCQREPYTPPGQRTGRGTDSVLRYLLEDLRRKPAPPGIPAHHDAGPSEPCPDCAARQLEPHH